MDSGVDLDLTERSLPNTRSRRLLLVMGVALAVGWLLASLFLGPAIRVPSPWTELGAAVIVGFGLALFSSKTPLTVIFEDDRVILRHAIRWNRIRRNEITFIEYRLIVSQVEKPVRERYYAASIWSGRRRRADVGIDGPIAQRLMSWFGPEKSAVRIYRGGRVIEERRAVPGNH